MAIGGAFETRAEGKRCSPGSMGIESEKILMSSSRKWVRANLPSAVAPGIMSL